jgi:hypothetical protein
MSVLLANAFPVVGVWLYGFMAVLALVLLPVFPFILRRRRRRAREVLHAKIEKAREKILEDGIVEGPKGPYVPHRSSGVKTTLYPHNETGPPKSNAFHGMPWN